MLFVLLRTVSPQLPTPFYLLRTIEIQHRLAESLLRMPFGPLRVADTLRRTPVRSRYPLRNAREALFSLRSPENAILPTTNFQPAFT